MSYIYADVEALGDAKPVGTKQCVALVQTYAGCPATSRWKEGQQVLGEFGIAKGTAIATFVDGKYPNLPHGNHAALYISQDAAGITVIDQWPAKDLITKRYIQKKGKLKDGSFRDPSNNAEAFSVIE